MKESKTCSQCKQNKSLDNFYKYRRADRGGGVAAWTSYCRDCCRSRSKTFRIKKGLEHWRKQSAKWREKNRDAVRLASSEWRERLKAEVYAAYGNRCACCGEDETRFLSIDHINENGAEHRRTETGSKGHRNSGTGAKMYGWLKRHGFPKGNFQLLCANCNVGKHFNGGICPHEYQYRKLRLLS